MWLANPFGIVIHESFDCLLSIGNVGACNTKDECLRRHRYSSQKTLDMIGSMLYYHHWVVQSQSSRVMEPMMPVGPRLSHPLTYSPDTSYSPKHDDQSGPRQSSRRPRCR